jgi:hypothetical protein
MSPCALQLELHAQLLQGKQTMHDHIVFFERGRMSAFGGEAEILCSNQRFTGFDRKKTTVASTSSSRPAESAMMLAGKLGGVMRRRESIASLSCSAEPTVARPQGRTRCAGVPVNLISDDPECTGGAAGGVPQLPIAISTPRTISRQSMPCILSTLDLPRAA